jgi:Rap1a immunity proteins
MNRYVIASAYPAGRLHSAMPAHEWSNTMRLTLIATVLMLMLGTPYAEERQQAPETFRVGLEATNLISMNVTNLRDALCGGEYTQGNQDAKNAKFIGCVMYVLGAVDMMWEWQKVDPKHARLCVPRTVTAGELIIVVQEHIEATTPWRSQHFEAAPIIVAAIAAKWPCPRDAR